MAPTPTGLHHVSALSAHIGRTHDFYTRVLGMRPLLRTVNQDEPSMYHLFYGDGAGSPGSEMTVFDLPRAAPERPGNQSISLTTFRVAGEGTLEYWADRLVEHAVGGGEISERDGRPVLDFADREGTRLSLVDDAGEGVASPWEGSPVPAERQIRGLGYTMVTVPEHAPTDRFLREGLGLRHDHEYHLAGAPEHRVHVYGMGDGGAHAQIHVVVRDDLPRARSGAGAVHHVALRVPEGEPIAEWAERLRSLGYPNSGVVERYYFTSVYVREPNQILFELATDDPGFQVDGPLDGERLRLPPFLQPRRAEIESRLRPLTIEHP